MQLLSRLYDRHFQLCFVAFLLRDEDFLSHVANDIEPEFFSDETLQRIVRLILQFYETEKSAPNRLIFHELDKLRESKHIPEDTYKLLNLAIDELFGYELQNRRYLLQEFDRFARHRRISKMLMPFSEHIERGEFEKAEDMMKEVFSYRPSKTNDLGRRYNPDPIDRIRRRLREEEDRFWTLIPELDKYVKGLLPGQLGVWQSQKSGFGKSAALGLLARSFVFQKKKVLIYTSEMSVEDWEDRLDQIICGLTSKNLLNGNTIYKDLSRILSKGGEIWIEEFPALTTRISDLRDRQVMLQNVHGFYADAVLIDTADDLAAETKSANHDLYSRTLEVYQALKTWLREDRLVGWTVTQSNRAGMEAAQLGQQHVSHGLAKVQKPELCIAITRTPEEEKAGITKLTITKDRHDKANVEITIHSDFERMLFWTMGND